MKKWFNEKILGDNKKTLLFISGATFLVLFIYQLVLFSLGLYFHSNSDDLAQYSPILIQYINYFKEGNFSFYNFSNNTGASIFADTYYVPIDIFSLLAFLLSFIMNGTIAFSIANLSKIFFGVIVFAYFLQRKGIKNCNVCLLSLMYFSFGGCWTLLTFPTYFSLFFYLPLSLLFLDFYNKGKTWLMPLYSFALVMYNFYNAYALFIFMVLVFVVVKVRDDYKGLKMLAKDVVLLGLNMVLGVIMGFVLFVPSVLYILNYSVRNNAWYMWLFDVDMYVNMVRKLFVYDPGAFTFNSGSYVLYQFNYYIGVVGIFLLVLLFTMKDRVSRIYKWSLCCVLVLMIIPVFSMIFSGVAIPYTRWFNFINIILIYMLGHVLENYDFSTLKGKKLLSVVGFIVGLYFVCLVAEIIMLFVKDSYSDIYNFFANFLIFIVFGVFVMLFALFILIKKKELVVFVWALEMGLAAAVNLSVPLEYHWWKIEKFESLNELVDSIPLNEGELSRVYIDEKQYNLSRHISSSFVNEWSFHSFFTKYMYSYLDLSEQDEKVLYTGYLNRLNPYSSRVMDYKYVAIRENRGNYSLPNFEYLYSKEGYMVYENKAYQPFYVYDSYYNEKDILDLTSYKSYLELERALSKGVVLDGEYEGLEKLEIDYDYSRTQIKSIFSEADKKIDFTKYNDFGYDDGYVYFKDSDMVDVASIQVVYNDGSIGECEPITDLIACKYSSNIKEINIDGDYSDLKYLVTVSVNEKEYVLLLLDEKEGEYNYLNYYAGFEHVDRSVFLNKGKETSKLCVGSVCDISDFEFDHILISVAELICREEVWEGYNFEYYYDNFDDVENVSDRDIAMDKNLTYDNSTIRLQYSDISESSKDRVVVIPVTYSEEWQIDGNSDDYELVRVNGGFLGIIVKNNVKNIDVSITFKPTGVKTGVIGSLLGFTIYGVYCFFVSKKSEKKEDILEG